jgi:hypothetical protein
MAIWGVTCYTFDFGGPRGTGLLAGIPPLRVVVLILGAIAGGGVGWQFGYAGEFVLLGSGDGSLCY